MSKTLQFRRGSTALIGTFAGSDGELFVDTSKLTVVVMDGATLGGTPLATENFVTSALLRSATTSLQGTVKVDGTSITITSGLISVPLASSSQIGVVRADGTSIVISSGVLSLSTNWTTSINVSGTVVMSSPFSHRNRIINGTFVIWQRGTTTGNASVQSQQTPGIYLADRWTTNNFNQVLQSNDVPTGAGFQYSLEWTATSVLTYAYASQRIESINCYDLVSSQCTLSFWVKNVSGPANFNVEIQTPYTVDGFNTSTYINFGAIPGATSTSLPIGVWTKYSVVIPASYMNANIANGMEIRFVRDNTGVSQTRLTGVQFEVGPKETPFERIPYGNTLFMCQRYFELVGGTTGTWQGAYFHQRYKVTKRGTPVLTLWSGGVSGANYDAGLDTLNSFRLPGSVTASGASDYTIAANAEL